MKRKPAKLAFQGGAYALALTGMLLAVLIVVNVLAAILPDSMTQFDISAAKLYSVTSNTKNVVSNLSEDVTIYWIAQPDEEDEILRNLLSRYESLSDHIKVVKRNPDVYPAFAEPYTDEEVKNNSLVVEAGERSRYIAFDNIYLTEPDMSLLGYSASFDGEGAITSAIDYCVSENQPVLYQLEGHGELPLPEVFLDQLTKANMEVQSLSLLNSDGIPEDCAALMIHAPSSDLSPEEAEQLGVYVEQGGRLLVLAGPQPEGMLPVLYSILEPYGVTSQSGIVVEEDRAHYAFRTPYVLLPEIQDTDITRPLLEEHYYPILPVSQGLNVEQATEQVRVLLTTSEDSFNDAQGYRMEDYERSASDLDGPFAVAVSIQNEQDGKIVWYASSMVLDPLYNAYSSGANVDLIMNTLTDFVGESESLAIRSKSLNYSYLTISDSTAAMLKVVLIGLFPLSYLGFGAWIVLAKRKEQKHETA